MKHLKQFQAVAIGGTFDRLHMGHKAFILFALSLCDQLFLGLTSDQYVLRVKPGEQIVPFDKRKEELNAFLNSQGVANRVHIIEINKNEIPKDVEDKVHALVASEGTLKGAEVLNKQRVTDGLPPLPIIPFPLVLDQEKKPIASTRIRRGLIDRNGNKYVTQDMLTFSYVLPQRLRAKLKKPLGDLLDPSHINRLSGKLGCLVTVGDITTKTFLDEGVIPTIGIIDFIVERKKRFHTILDLGFLGSEHVYVVENKPSHIGPQLFITLSHLFQMELDKKRSSVIQVVGEEDLTVLPAILLSPLDTIIVYGQPKVGMVRIMVTEKLKQEMRELLAQFDKEFV